MRSLLPYQECGDCKDVAALIRRRCCCSGVRLWLLQRVADPHADPHADARDDSDKYALTLPALTLGSVLTRSSSL